MFLGCAVITIRCQGGGEGRRKGTVRGKKRNKDEDKWQSKKILKVMDNNVVYAYNICFNFILCTHTLL